MLFNRHAFSRLKELKKVVMHDGVRFIAPNAFYNCENLTEISGLENAETMKSFGGFENCTNLQSVKISETVGLISERAFIGCKNLRSINLPEGLRGISVRAFAGCENLESIDIPAGVEIISTEAFAGCKNLTVTFLEDNKRYIDDVIKEQREIERQYLEEMSDLEEYPEESENEILKIQSVQKELLDLFIKGTNNKNAVLEITKDIKFPRPTNKIKVARYKKDWLPYFTNPLFSEFDELKEYRKAKKNNEDTSSK